LEFLLVGESKLKIIMTAEEMVRHKLSPDQDAGTASQRRAFWQVLELAKREVGFDPAGDKVLIQFYPTKPGGCEVFVTKLGILSGTSARIVSKSDRVSMLSRRKSFYIFDTAEDIISAAKAIKRLSDEPPESDVYVSDKGKFYLALDEYAKGGELAEFPCVLEYGRILAPDFGVYVEEHCEKVAGHNGIDSFSRL